MLASVLIMQGFEALNLYVITSNIGWHILTDTVMAFFSPSR